MTTVTVTPNAGTGATATLASGSNDAAGQIILTVVVDAMTPDNATGVQCNVTFDTPLASAPIALLTRQDVNPDITSDVGVYPLTSTTQLSLAFGNTNWMAGSYTYYFNYIVVAI